MKLTNLKTLHMENPMGIDVNPYFSWMLESEEQNVLQTAYCIRVRDEQEDLVWDTGRVTDSRSVFVEYSGDTLESSHSYRWEVTVWDDKGNQATGEAAFETGLLLLSDWRAKWVTAGSLKKRSWFGNLSPQPPVMFRKGFDLKEGAVRARLYGTCRGIYRLTVNGGRPDDRELAPGHTAYKKYLCYQTYDVTALLHPGRNVIGMYVGDGWYSREGGAVHAVLFQLEVFYENGSRDTIVSDGNVKTCQGPVRSSVLFEGEFYDERLKQRDWDRPEFVDRNRRWAEAGNAEYGFRNLIAQPERSVGPGRLIRPAAVLTSPRGEIILDFGELLTGRLRVTIHMKKGNTLALDYTDTLDPEGNFSTGTQGISGCPEQRDSYISDGYDRVWEPAFTVHVFRYVRVKGFLSVRAADFTAVELGLKQGNMGGFSCSDERLNTLYEQIRCLQRGASLSGPEGVRWQKRAGWTGDVTVGAQSMLQNEDTTGFFTGWLSNLACEQKENGGVPDTVPDEGKILMTVRMAGFLEGEKEKESSAGFGDAAVLVPYAMYLVTGNTVILKQQYPSMKRWCSYIFRRARARSRKGSLLQDESEKYLWDTGCHLGAWLMPDESPKTVGKELLPALREMSGYLAPMYAWLTVSRMAEISEVLGEKEDAGYYLDTAAKMKEALITGLIENYETNPPESMDAYVIPVCLGLISRKHRRYFASRIARMLHEKEGRPDTGLLGRPYLLDALCILGRQDLAYLILFEGKINLNHYSWSCVDEWLFRYVGGIEALDPGFRRFRIQPRPDRTLTWGRRTFFSEYGKIECSWKREEGKFCIEIEIPCNTEAEIILPGQEMQKMGSGKYMLEVPDQGETEGETQ